MVEGLGMTFELGPAYCCPEVWKCCSHAATHTHIQIATSTNGTVPVPNVHVTKQFFLHYKSRPGNVYTASRCEWPKFNKCVRKNGIEIYTCMNVNLHSSWDDNILLP